MANKAIKCGKMFDSTTGAVRENMVIFTDGERIASVVPAAEANVTATRSSTSATSSSPPA